MAHQFAKNFHQATTAALQQFLPGTSMTTTAYSKSGRDDEPSVRQSSSKGFPPQQQPQYFTSSTTSSAAYNKEREVQLTSQQQQHMAAYQQKFSEAANMAQAAHQQSVGQEHQMDVKPPSGKKSKSSKKSKASSQTQSNVIPQDLLLNSALSQQSTYPNQQMPPHGYPPYGGSGVPGKTSSSVTSVDSSNTVGSKTGVPPGVPGSAFNFAPTPPLGIPGTGLYPEATNYLDEFRGTPNPYYPLAAAAGHRNPAEVGTDKTNPAASTVSSPYHQFLSHPSSRSSYPFINPTPFDPLQQQWNLQREEQLRAQMMLASNPYSQSAYPRHLWG